MGYKAEKASVDYVSKPLIDFEGFADLIEAAETQLSGVVQLDDPDTWASDMLTGYELDRTPKLTPYQTGEFRSRLDEIRSSRDEEIVRPTLKVIVRRPGRLLLNLDDSDGKLGDERRDILKSIETISGREFTYYQLHHSVQIGISLDQSRIGDALRLLTSLRPEAIKLGRTVVDLTVGGHEKFF